MLKTNQTIFNSFVLSGLGLLLFISILTGCTKEHPSGLKFRKLFVEYAENPINIDIPDPRFFWIIASSGRNQHQSAYQVFVATAPELLSEKGADLWDSGKITDNGTTWQSYKGQSLKSNHRYYWKVLVWDGNGNKWESPVAWFETAILDNREWKASWISICRRRSTSATFTYRLCCPI